MSFPRKAESLERWSLVCFVFLPFATGHFLSYVLRSINAVLAPVLAASMGFNASAIGLLTSAYFLAFAVAQLPIGLALDRFGPRRVQLVLLSLAAAGCVLFAISNSLAGMVAARALIGLGLAACFMAAIKAISDWVPSKRLPSIHGFLLAVGGLGAMASTLPAQLGIEYLGWRWLFIAIATAILASAAAIFALSPEPSSRAAGKRPTLRSALDVYRDRAFIRTIRILLLPHTIYFAVQALWMGSWLHDVAGFSSHEVAVYLFGGMTAIVVATIAIGQLTEYLSARGMKPLDIAAIGVIAFFIVQIAIVLDARFLAPVIAISFPLFGTFCGLQFTIIAQSVPASLTGRASTSLNVLIFTGSFLVQAGIGAILAAWTPDTLGTYPASAYRTAFAVLLILQAPGIIFWLLEKKPKPLIASVGNTVGGQPS